jgi:hypothetical protein
MGEFRLPLRSDYGRDEGEEWGECCLCGSRRYQAIVHFTNGTTTPAEHETVTGATSLDTGVLDKYVLISGTFAGSDAAGVFILTSPTGYDAANLEIFTSGELLNGSTAGNSFAKVNRTGAVQITGRLIPGCDLVTYEGKDYCKAHFQFKFARTWQDEAEVDYNENDREA